MISFLSERYSKVNLSSHIKDEIKSLFKDNKISKYYHYFIDNIELLPIVANLMNYSAKTIDEKYYDFKNTLIREIAVHYPRSWVDEDEGVVFFETVYGQVSFHVEYSTIKFVKPRGLNAQDRQWDGKDNQSRALALIDEVINDIEK